MSDNGKRHQVRGRDSLWLQGELKRYGWSLAKLGKQFGYHPTNLHKFFADKSMMPHELRVAMLNLLLEERTKEKESDERVPISKV